MHLTRRDFGKLVGTGVLGTGLGITTMGLSCETVFNDIANYLPVGLAAFNEILSLIDPAAAVVVAPITALIKAAFADLAAAVTEYENAPAADKATWKQKIAEIMQVVIDNLQKFWSDLNLPDGSIASTIAGVLQIILSTLAAFLPLANGVLKASVAKKQVTFTPVKRSRKQFKTEVNAVFVKYGYASHQVY